MLAFERAFEDGKAVHIVTELLEGGELYEAVIECKRHRTYFPDEDAS